MSVQSNISCILVNKNEVICNGIMFKTFEERLTPGTKMFYIYLILYFILVIFAGLMSGLTMGLLSLDQTQLAVLQNAGKPKEQKYAKKILPIIQRHHLLLVTLLLANAVAVETMPIFMDRITNPIVAILVSVTAVLLFGEVVPQALCTRYGLAIGYYLSPLVIFLMFLLFIIAWPISKLLDCLLGTSHTTFFRRAELKQLVDMHQEIKVENEEPLTVDEALIIKGALDLKDKVARDAHVPLEVVFMLESSTVLDADTMTKIIDVGHSRIPIYQKTKQNIVGLLLVKTIIKLDPDDNTPVTSVMRPKKSISKFYEEEPLYNILNACQTGRNHMCIVLKDQGENDSTVVGIITLEDIIEEILQEEIVDETDKYVDVVKKIKVAGFIDRYSSGNSSNYLPRNRSLTSYNFADERTPDQTTPLLASC